MMTTVKAMLHRPLMAAVLLASLCAGGVEVRADEDDQDRAREAMLRGEVRPLAELLKLIESTFEGDILEVELEEEEGEGQEINGQWMPLFLYEIKLLTPQGNLVELEYDARNLELLDVEGHDSDQARKDREDDREDDD